MGELLEHLENYEEAVIVYDSAIQLDPDNFDFYYRKGDALHKLNRDQEALNVYYETIDRDNGNVNGSRKYGELLAQHGMYEDALKFYDYAIELKPDHTDLADLYCKRGDVLHHLGHNQEALAAYEQALRYHPFTFDCARRGIREIKKEEHPQVYGLYSNIKKLSFNSKNLRYYCFVLAAIFIYVLILPNIFSISLTIFIFIMTASINVFANIAKFILKDW